MNRFFSIKLFAGLLSFVLLGCLCSCNKQFDNNLRKDYGSDSAFTNKGVRKTLLIVIDGAVGAEVRNVAPVNLNVLADFSIYSWDAIADTRKDSLTNATGWSTLFTGVNVNKHKVVTDFSTNDFADYPSLFSRIKQERPDWRTSAFCSSPDVANFLAVDATEKKSFGEDDAAVKEAAKNELATKDPALLLAQFHSVDKAGMSGAYSASDAGYKAAIIQTDAYIGEILTAMRARPTFKDENWMVIITSNKGSNIAADPAGANQNAFNDSRRNTFFFCYNPRFNSKDLIRPSVFPYIGTAPYLSNESSRAIRGRVRSGGTTYDLGSSGSFTIECKVKIPAGSYNYPAFLSKRASFAAGVVGWVFFLEGNFWQINFSQTGRGNQQIKGGIVSDGAWHTLTAVIRQEGAARNVYTYTDGVLYPFTGNRNISGMGDLSSPQDLTVGFLTTASNSESLKNYFVTDIKFYNTALPDDFIASNYCRTSVSPDNPYLNNLLGYWPGTDPVNDQLLDFSGNGHNFVMEGNYGVASFNDVSNQLCPQPSYTIVPNSADVAVQIYQWFGIIVPSSWRLDGQNWIPSYTDIGG